MAATETIHIPAREGRGVSIRAGDRVRVIDPEGGQVADVFAFSADDPSEYHSAEHTRVYVGRLFPRVGEQFVTNRRRPILTLEADDSPGIHDMLCAACDPTRYQGLGVEGWHASCQENLLGAMHQLGVERVEVPQPINLFMNIPIGTDAELGWLPAPTRPGDSTTLRAELDCYVVVSACPQDLVQINAGTPGPIDLEITRAEPAATSECQASVGRQRVDGRPPACRRSSGTAGLCIPYFRASQNRESEVPGHRQFP